MRPAAKTPFDTPENLWGAIKYSRDWRLGMQRAAIDAENGTVHLENVDALPPEE